MELLQFIAGLAVLIFVHELGHFLAARLFKVNVEEFGIGFPPRLAKLFEHQGTEYTLNWIPLGGFVRLGGENDPDAPGGFGSASPFIRLAILFAGPLTNILVGLALGTALFFSLGEPILDQVLIYQVAPASPAEQAGLQPNDRFVSFNGQAIDSVQKLQTLIAERLDIESELVIQRGEEMLTLLLTPRSNPPTGEGAIGVILDNPTRPISIAKAANQSVIASCEYVRNLVVLPVRIAQGNISPEESRLVGYKGMYDIYREVRNPMWFFTIISISLGIMNLLPIPALDGGRITLILPEILFRRRVPAKFENALHLIGFAVLLLLLIYVNLQDFINPIVLP
jgi:regulator of sigma E protease